MNMPEMDWLAREGESHFLLNVQLSRHMSQSSLLNKLWLKCYIAFLKKVVKCTKL